MLVVVSDLHMTDGTTGDTLSPGAFSIFARRIRDMAASAGYRADGSYRPVEAVDIVLLGDILDVIRSTEWMTSSSIRPWDKPHDPMFVERIGQITAAILDRNEPALAVLRELSSPGGLTVPPMLRAGRPAADEPEEKWVPVPVRIHYMVGNHDWFFHLPGPAYDALRKKLVQHMGLANPFDKPFPHDIAESGPLLETMRRHKVVARHGDLYDPFNFEGDRDTSSLGDVIVVELVNRFAAEVESQLHDDLPAGTLVGLREIDNVRPLLLIPVWIDGLLERTCGFPAMRKRVKGIWDRLADEFLANSFVRERDTWNPLDLVDGLERALRFSRRLSIGWAGSIATWLQKIRGASCDSYYHHALVEQDFRNRRARHIVYGHTHAAESVPLDASFSEGFVMNQMYFNSGTWRRVHRQTRLAATEHEFIAHDEMSYTAFYYGDQRGGRPYETWSGTLGFYPAEIAIHRIDPSRARHVPGQPISTSNLHGHAPHFTTSPRKPRRASTGRI